MAADTYINIDGNNSITYYWCYAYACSYGDIAGYEECTDMAYTKITAEVPTALIGPIPITDYWSNSPRGITKFSTSNTFQLTFTPDPSSMRVHINSGEVAYSLLPNPGVFSVDLPQEDGYLWVEYIIDVSDASKVFGDTRTTIEAAGGIKSEVIYPVESLDTIVRLRRIINNMEAYLGIIPTTWIGGRTNTLRSGPSNLLEKVTPLYAEHLLELRTAIQKIEDMFDTMVPIALPRYYFSEIGYSDVYMVEYVEEIMEAIQIIERIILDPEYYGG